MMIVDEVDEEVQVVSTSVRSKKRAIVDDEDVVAIEEQVVTGPKAPVTPAKVSTKKGKTDDGKELEVLPAAPVTATAAASGKASSAKKTPLAEEAKEKEEAVLIVAGPPKDLEKLRPCSSGLYHPVEDAPFYKG